jgi:hypothetical protein
LLKARGMMSRYIIQNKLTKLEDIRYFDSTGYQFSESDSSADRWVFYRAESKVS